VGARIFKIAFWTIAACMAWYILTVAQGHGGCVWHPPFSPPLSMRDRDEIIRQATVAWDQICNEPRTVFFWETGATILAAIVIGIVTVKKTPVPR